MDRKLQDYAMALDPGLAALPVCDLETLGRVTGRSHVVEMWFAADPDRERLYMLSGGRDDADWVLNLRRNPSVKVRLGGRWRSGVASVLLWLDD
jgi:deazaflavin-dependent oxidoreductase (nitroreductase family)